MSRTIIACFDDQARPDSAIGDYGAWAARQLGAPLCLMHVLEHQHIHHEDYSGQIGLGTREQMLEKMTEEEGQAARRAREDGRRMLEALKARLGDDGLAPGTQQRHGTLEEALAEHCTSDDLVVVGRSGYRHASGEGRGAMGEHVDTLVQQLSVPMLIVPSDFRVPARAMVAFDGSDRGLEQLSVLIERGWLAGLETHVVHVGEPADEQHASRGARLLQDAGINAQGVTLEGDAGRKLPAYAEEHDVDITIMGAYGHSSLRRWIKGSTTRKLLDAMTGAILLMR